jgi:hypothetical protein
MTPDDFVKWLEQEIASVPGLDSYARLADTPGLDLYFNLDDDDGPILRVTVQDW